MMPRNENHTSITGPNALPILLVPAHCTAKSVLMMTRVIRTTCACPLPRKRFIAGMLRRPSTAVVTVTDRSGDTLAQTDFQVKQLNEPAEQT